MYRKLSLALSVGLVAAAAPLAAQNGLGVVGGYVSSNFVVEPAKPGATYSARSGFAGGLSLTMGVANGVSIGPEALYVQKGSNLALVSGALSGSGWAKIGYVEVPLLLRVGFKAGSSRIFVTAGPQFSYRLNCTASLPVYSGGVISNNTGDCDTVVPSPGGIKTTDYGVIFGAGVAMGKISVSVRYDLGMANVNKDQTTGADTDKNKTIFVLLGLALGK